MKSRKKLHYLLGYTGCSLSRFSYIIKRNIIITLLKLLGIIEFTASDINNIADYFSREAADYIFFDQDVD